MSEQRRHERRYLQCPCGELLQAPSEEQLVTLAQEHLTDSHPGRDYTRSEILLMAF